MEQPQVDIHDNFIHSESLGLFFLWKMALCMLDIIEILKQHENNLKSSYMTEFYKFNSPKW